MVMDRLAVWPVIRMPPPRRVPAALAAAPGSHRAGRPSEQGPHLAAAWHEDQCDVVARLEPLGSFADLLDDAGRFVAERHRHRARAVAVDDGEVGMA